VTADEKPDIVYGRLLESAHISGYGFECMTDELEWLLEALHPVFYVTARRLWPAATEFQRFRPDEWAAEVYLLHRNHHRSCPRAQRSDPVYHTAAIQAARAKSRIWVPKQGGFELREAG